MPMVILASQMGRYPSSEFLQASYLRFWEVSRFQFFGVPISLQPALGIAAEQIWDEGVAAVAAVRLADLTNMGDEDAEQDIIVGDRAVESVLTLAARDRIDAVEFDEVGLPFEECLRPEGKCLLAQYDNNWAADSDVFELLAQDALRRRRS